MAKIEFNNAEKDEIVRAIQRYFDTELDQELGQFDAEFLLDFFAEKIGPRFYNQALSDARLVVEQRLEGISDGFYELEKPLPR
ncbi:DUF2164 domain-containing protein [Gallaecimonas xiamenensis]|uniref:DUF2164 domain-containing protein n=1 Tax=Gallaecimonas xiamenensis 3-C-1 TaxID=745411 RepID=K2JEK1_9GAMM|nr:DUF2164 domain-containing protein [Gallaecimonas xiamenensis]EKE73077.1 hypothetical protein B3C1_10687 [Gallaecimonas xiamenensis 3-C-1]